VAAEGDAAAAEEGSEVGWAAEAANGEDGETAPRAATLPIEAIRNHTSNSSEINQQYLITKIYTQTLNPYHNLNLKSKILLARFSLQLTFTMR
jgi:hypothetical protein